MFSPEQLALLGQVRETSEQQTWAPAARSSVEQLPMLLANLRCKVSRRNLTDLASLRADELPNHTVVSFCARHGLFHLYRDESVLNAANTAAVATQNTISLAEDELAADEIKRLRGRVMHARATFYASVDADERAMQAYRRFGFFEHAAPSTPAIVAPVAALKSRVGTPSQNPLLARQALSARVRREIGISDSQLIEWYRCFRKKPYDNVAAAVNATMLVHERFERMAVYLCGHCASLHIGHRSHRGEQITPAILSRAITKWQTEPQSAARFLEAKHIGLPLASVSASV